MKDYRISIDLLSGRLFIFRNDDGKETALVSVAHDSTLSGSGTEDDPLYVTLEWE
jgi:hypothetical protein